jgi:hypothetical protein
MLTLTDLSSKRVRAARIEGTQSRSVLRVVATLSVLTTLSILASFGCGSSEVTTTIFEAPGHPKLADDGYAWWMLLRVAEMPHGWAEHQRYEPLSADALTCLGSEPVGRTGYAAGATFTKQTPSSLFPQNGDESVFEDISVFDTSEHATAFLSSPAEPWQCFTSVINAGKANESVDDYFGASLSDLHLLQAGPNVLSYRSVYSQFEWLRSPPLGALRATPPVEVDEDRVAQVKDNVVIVVYHRLIGSSPEAASTEYFLSKAQAKIGLQPPPPSETPASSPTMR